MKKELVSLNGTKVNINDLGIENLKSVVAMILSVIATIQSMLNKKIGIIGVVRSLKTILPFIVAMVKHGKTVLAEIKDLSSDEFTELVEFITTGLQYENAIEAEKDINNAISFLDFFGRLKNSTK